MNQDIRFCTTSDGVRIAYAVSGDGPPLLMPASWLSHLEHQWKSLAWQPWLEALSQRYMLIRYDSRGCGLSDRDNPPLSFDGWMRDIEAVADAAGFARFDMLAICWGSPIAVEYAAHHPERVRRLILYGGYAEGRLRGARAMNGKDATVLLDMTRIGWGQANHAFCRVWGSFFQPNATLAHYQSWTEQQALSTSPETAVRLLEIGWHTDVRSAARAVQCPTLALLRLRRWSGGRIFGHSGARRRREPGTQPFNCQFPVGIAELDPGRLAWEGKRTSVKRGAEQCPQSLAGRSWP